MCPKQYKQYSQVGILRDFSMLESKPNGHQQVEISRGRVRMQRPQQGMVLTGDWVLNVRNAWNSLSTQPHLANPGPAHINAPKRVMHYLKGTG